MPNSAPVRRCSSDPTLCSDLPVPEHLAPAAWPGRGVHEQGCGAGPVVAQSPAWPTTYLR